MPTSRPAPLAITLALALAACGAADDGASVRSIDGAGGEISGGSASGSMSGSASASAVAGATCDPVGDPADADATVAVELAEWTIEPTGDVPAGTVALEAVNRGAEPHELVVIRGLAPAELPTDADGSLVEDELPDGALVGEVEPFPSRRDLHGRVRPGAGDLHVPVRHRGDRGRRHRGVPPRRGDGDRGHGRLTTCGGGVVRRTAHHESAASSTTHTDWRTQVRADTSR